MVSILSPAGFLARLCISGLMLVCTLLTPTVFAQQSTESLHPITLQLRWHHQFQFAGYYAAKHQGYFQQAGLDVEIIAGAPGLEPVVEVLSGKAQFGVANSELLHQRLKGQPLVALAAIFQHSASVFMARQDAEIYSPQDLIGRKVMMISKSADVGLIAMMHNEGIDINRVQIIKSSYNIESLINGDVDVFNSYLTNEPYFMAQKDIPFTILRPSTYGVDFYSDILFTTESMLEADPELVRKFRSASLKGWKYAMENPKEMVQVIMAKYDQRGKTQDHLEFEAESMRGLIMPDVVQYGHMNPGRWRHMADTFIKQGMAEPEYDLSGFIYDPNPKPDESHWYAIVVSLFLGLVVLGSITTVLSSYNRKLKTAINFGLQTQYKLQQQTAHNEAIFRSTPDATLICNKEGEIVHCNPAFTTTFGYSVEQAIGKNTGFLYENENIYEKFISKHMGLSSYSRLSDYEVDYRRSDGTIFPSHTISGPILDAEGKISGCILVMRDITVQRRSQQETVRLALTDALTGLANRRQFNRRSNELFQLAKRQNQLLSLALMDLDYFKQVNDKFGHPIGDQLLIKMGDILKQTFRETDIIARIGGDEFAILQLNPNSKEAICHPAERLIEALETPLDIAGKSVSIGMSFGVATYPVDTENFEDLYRLADRALYHSKNNGRNQYSMANNELSNSPVLDSPQPLPPDKHS